MRRHLWRALRVGGLCLLSGCATPQCDPAKFSATCAAEKRAVAARERTDTPTCDALVQQLNEAWNQDLSNQGGGGYTGGGTGTPGD